MKKSCAHQAKKIKIQNILLKRSASSLESKIASLDEKIKANLKENNRLYNRMSIIFDVFAYKTRKDAEAKGFKVGAKVRIKETSELPKHLRKRREQDFWKWFDISGVRKIHLAYCNRNTGRPHIDKDKMELIVHLTPHLQRKDNGNGITPIVRISDIELVKTK